MSFADSSQFAGLFAGTQEAPMSQSPTQSPTRAGRQEEKITTLPVTISMVLQAAQSQPSGANTFTIHDSEPTMIYLVAVVESFTKQSASVEMMLNDSSGRIQVKQYGDTIEAVAPGTYVIVAGSVRTSPSLHISAQCMRPITSADEISFHMLQTARAYMQSRIGGTTSSSKAADAMTTGPFSSPPKSPIAYPMDVISGATPGSGKAVAAAIDAAATPTPARAPTAVPVLTGAGLKAQVLVHIKEHGTGKDEGVGLTKIVELIGKSASGADVRAAIDNLKDEGEVYDTIDEEHFSAF